MTKLQRVFLVKAFDPDSDHKALSTRVLVAGKGRESHGHAPVDIELEDDCDHRRVFVRVSGKSDSFVPYEHVERAEVAEQPKLAVVPQKGKR